MSNVIANNPGQISELSRRSALYRARPIKLKGSCLLLKEITVKQKETLILQGKFLSALRNNKKELELLKVEIDKLKEKIN